MSKQEKIQAIRPDVLRLMDEMSALVAEPDREEIGKFFLSFTKMLMRCVACGMSLTETGLSPDELTQMSEMLLDGREQEALGLLKPVLELIERHSRPALHVVR